MGWRWPRPGATRTPNARRPKPCGPGATASRHRALGGDCRTAVPTVRRSQRSLNGGEQGMPTGGRTEQAYKHRARDVGETANLRSFFRNAPASRDAEARGFLGTPASRAPSDLISKAPRDDKARTHTRRESDGPCRRHSGAGPPGPAFGRPDDKLRPEPGIHNLQRSNDALCSEGQTGVMDSG